MQQTDDAPEATSAPWWHPIDMATDECWRLAVGTLAVYVRHKADEWLVGTKQLDDIQENFKVEKERLQDMPDDVTLTRYVFRQAPAQLRLTPKSLDRPVVVKTDQPVQVPPGESITFYISSPVCVSIDLPGVPMTLQEVPTLQLSDTWFGPSTRVGELCYATRTHARNTREEVPLRPHRAVTPVTVTNQTTDFLAIKKLSIPVPVLAMYGAEDGTLWTDPVVLTQLQDNSMISFAIGKDQPTSERISAPRLTMNKGGLMRAFSSIFAIS